MINKEDLFNKGFNNVYFVKYFNTLQGINLFDEFLNSDDIIVVLAKGSISDGGLLYCKLTDKLTNEDIIKCIESK